jgi:hypothetical protein
LFETFGILKTSGGQMPFPNTLIVNADLLPLMFIGEEGDDFPQILWDGL